MKRRGMEILFILLSHHNTIAAVAVAELPSREELSAVTSSDVSTSGEALSSSTNAAINILDEEDSSARNAQRAMRLLPPNLVERSTQHIQERESRNQCLILTFGDYERGKWQSALTFLYK